MEKQSIINKLPEVIKCIIYDHVSYTLNYLVELNSNKFIGNPINLLHNEKNNYFNFNHQDSNKYFYHINKLTKVKTPLHFICLNCNLYGFLLPQEILNKLQTFALRCDELFVPNNLPCIKILKIAGYFTEIPNYKGLLDLDIYSQYLTKIPNIVGLKKLNCSRCYELTKIPHIVGLQELNCAYCRNLTKIPNIVGLLKLNCSYCYKLIEIPNIIGLKKLDRSVYD